MFPWGKFPQTIICNTICSDEGEPEYECLDVARKVILHAPEINVDNTDRQPFDIGAGQHFTSRSARKEWMRQNDVYELGPEDSSRALADRKRYQEKKADTGVIPSRL